MAKSTAEEIPVKGLPDILIIEPAQYIGIPADGMIFVPWFAVKAWFYGIQAIIADDDPFIDCVTALPMTGLAHIEVEPVTVLKPF
jgi:hypothetical protein